MYEVTISVDGIIQKMNVPGNNISEITYYLTNMYGTGKVQILSCRRI